MRRQRRITPSHRRERRRPPADHVVRAVTGVLRFVDRGGRWATLAMPDGSLVTLDLAGARMSVPDRNGDGRLSLHDLVPGDQVRITTRVPRTERTAPAALRVRRLTAIGRLAAT